MSDDRRPGLVQHVAPYTGGEIDGWISGMDNRSSDVDVPRSALRDAVNVDILSSGKPRMRRGMRQVIADPNAHSVFATTRWLVWATPTTLNISGPNLTKTVLLTDTRFAAPLSYCVVNGKIYFSNESINGTITEAGTYEPWGIAVPTDAPQLAASGAGTANRYIMVTCTFVTSTGEESGAPLGRKISCVDFPILSVTAIPQSSDSRVVATRLYFTDVDGNMFYAYADVPAGQTTYTINGGFFSKGMRLETQFMVPPPPGQLLSYKNGTIHIAIGNMVQHTEPLRYGLIDYDDRYYQFPDRVTLLHATDDGLFVSADETYFIKDAVTDDPDLQPILPYKAVEGTLVDIPESNDVIWFSERGFVRGSPSGEVVNLTETAIAVDKYERGAIGVVEYNGHRAVVATFKDRKALNPLVSSEYLAERDA